MIIYDIPQITKEDELALEFSFDGKSWMPINISKRKDYLKTKMKAHKDQVIGEDKEVFYQIIDIGNTVIFSQHYEKGQSANSKQDYHVIAQKKPVHYSTIGIKKIDGIEEEPFDVICNEDGTILTDLGLLKFLYDFKFVNRLPIFVTKKALVSLATYPPKTKEEFIGLDGLSEKAFLKVGEVLISAISDFSDGRRN